jgi:23S rRNA (adenine2503-C2)-methyltransferase
MSTAEIVEQVMTVRRKRAAGRSRSPGWVGNVVFMGMGRPLAN